MSIVSFPKGCAVIIGAFLLLLSILIYEFSKLEFDTNITEYPVTRNSKRVKHILASGRLADLPDSAKKIQYAKWNGVFTGQQFLKFEASVEHIEEFIKSSESIKSVIPIKFSEILFMLK